HLRRLIYPRTFTAPMADEGRKSRLVALRGSPPDTLPLPRNRPHTRSNRSRLEGLRQKALSFPLFLYQAATASRGLEESGRNAAFDLGPRGPPAHHPGRK